MGWAARANRHARKQWDSPDAKISRILETFSTRDEYETYLTEHHATTAQRAFMEPLLPDHLAPLVLQ